MQVSASYLIGASPVLEARMPWGIPRGMPHAARHVDGCRDAARHHQPEIREPAGRMADGGSGLGGGGGGSKLI